MNTSLYIGMQALEATQGALNATSNNIANSNTPGYTREIPQFTENVSSTTAGQVTGGGVNLNSLQSVRDELLNLQINQQTSAQSGVDTQSSSLQQVETFFSTSGNDIGSAFASFSTSLQGLSANSANAAAQQGVISSGQSLAGAFNNTANGLASVQSAADLQVTQTVGQINSLTKQIAQLNGQVHALTSAGKDGGTVEDQRDQLVQQLSKLTSVSISQSSDGEVITTGNGSPLVIGGQSLNLQTTTGTNGFQEVLDSQGNDITPSIQGGQLGGAIQVRDQVVPGYLTQLNTLATQFATAFNTAQGQGFDSNGNTGQAFFTVPATGAAAGLSVAITNPSLIAVSSDGSVGSNGNVANLSATLTTALPSGQTAAQSYSNLVFQVGNDTSNASAESSGIGQNLLQLTNQQSSVSGVSIDEETTNLIRYQTAYEAAARIISTVQQLNTVTLNMGSSGGY
ncbi:MAG TPA: flagellar hook-associated protein FlgK [Terracidiphilus sp.]|nr:flagellar hook-associated protein FlgK [Terracidiphilus sp.]